PVCDRLVFHIDDKNKAHHIALFHWVGFGGLLNLWRELSHKPPTGDPDFPCLDAGQKTDGNQKNGARNHRRQHARMNPSCLTKNWAASAPRQTDVERGPPENEKTNNNCHYFTGWRTLSE